MNLSDIKDGPKLFKNVFGAHWGPIWWRIFFTVVVIGIASAALTYAGQFGHGLFAGFGPVEKPSSQNCTVSGGTNYGTVQQNCGTGK